MTTTTTHRRQTALRARMMGLQETTRQARDDPMFHQLDEQAPGAAIFYTRKSIAGG